MKIDHIALYVADFEATKNFFTLYFGAASNEMYHNPRTGLKSYFLTFKDGGRLEIMNRPEVIAGKKGTVAAGYSHLAFSVGDEAEVDKLTARLEEDGYEVLSGPRRTGDGFYESCIAGPEGNQIEITV